MNDRYSPEYVERAAVLALARGIKTGKGFGGPPTMMRVVIDPSDVEKLPAADVAPVVRCKDCRYNAGGKKCLYPDSIIAVPGDDDFCSYGEKRRAAEWKEKGDPIEELARFLLDRQVFWCGDGRCHYASSVTCQDCTEAWLRERLKNDK